jgi:serine protease SohB
MSNQIFSWFQLSLGFLGVLALFLLFLSLLALLFSKKKHKDLKICVKKINETYQQNKNKILSEILTSQEFKETKQKKSRPQKSSTKEKAKKIFVLDFYGDIAASAVEVLREHISAIIQVAKPSCDEVVLRLESPGGLVHSYGLAASQLARLRDHNIFLTVCVDKVAASGGYLMACLANQIIAAPFAIVGSIGVVASFPNLNKFLRNKDIEYLEITAGEYKRTVTPFGELTEKGRAKFQQQIEETHCLFKDHVHKYRPTLDLNTVATGEHWYGTQAQILGLIDSLQTSDDYLLKVSAHSSIYHIFTPKKETLREKFLGSLQSLLSECLYKSTLSQKYHFFL